MEIDGGVGADPEIAKLVEALVKHLSMKIKLLV